MEARYGAAELDHALQRGIVHFNGAKPWKEACLNMDIWWSCYRKSLFFDESFCFDFWKKQVNVMDSLPLSKRIKLVGKYFRKTAKP